jgi:DNA repair photolyase
MPASQPSPASSLFPILPSQPTGIARLAAEAQPADAGHLVEFRALEVRSILNRSISKRVPWLEYSINPYRGCEFACRYCFARYTHEFLAPKESAQQYPAPNPTPNFRDPLAFERIIFLKQNAAWLLEQELRRIDPNQEIALGTATDPYQPVERRAQITRSLLEVFARRSGHRLAIITKSTLIARDLGLLTQIARRNTLTVHITITTPNAKLARILEPRAPRPDLRFATVRRLREAGIVTGILCSPLLPGITDTERAIDSMARRAAAANASFFAANPLFLKPCSRPTYLAFIREHYPTLIREYDRRYGTADFVSQTYRRQLAQIVAEARLKHGIPSRSQDTTHDSESPHPMANRRTVHLSSKPPEAAHPIRQTRLFA